MSGTFTQSLSATRSLGLVLAAALLAIAAGCGEKSPIAGTGGGGAGPDDDAGTGSGGAGGDEGDGSAGTGGASAVDAGPPISTAAGATSCMPACLTEAPACDMTNKTCRAPRLCDRCAQDADCGPTLACQLLDNASKVCVPRGVGTASCRVGAKCCEVEAQGTITVTTCTTGSMCPEPGADVSNASPAGAKNPPLRDLPRCAGCNGDDQCAAGMVCGTVPTGTSGFCVPSVGVTQCCVSVICLGISGTTHLPADGGAGTAPTDGGGTGDSAAPPPAPPDAGPPA